MTNTSGSDYVKVAVTLKKGRSLVALTDIPPNTVIIKDSAYTSVSKSPQFCSRCFDRLSTPQPKRPFLCPANCCDKGTEPFDSEEKSLVILCYLVAVRVISDKGFSYTKYCELTKQAPLQKRESSLSSDYTAIAQLVTRDLEIDQRDVDCVCDALALRPDFFLKKEETKFLVRHIFSTFPCNVQGVTFICEDDNGAFTEKRIGSGIYLTLALMNHSCFPNTRIHFEKSTVVVTTTEHVKAGEELFHNYGPNVLHHPWQERQDSLQYQYGFTCECPPCSLGRDKDLAHSLKCDNCGGPIWIENEYLVACNYCHQKEGRQYLCSRIDSIKEKIYFLEDSNSRNDVEIIDALFSDIGSLYLSESAMMGNMMDSCATLYAKRKEWSKAIECAHISCSVVKPLAGPLSHTYALEVLKLCRLKVQSGCTNQDLELVEDVKFALNTLKHCNIYDSKTVEFFSTKFLKGKNG